MAYKNPTLSEILIKSDFDFGTLKDNDLVDLLIAYKEAGFPRLELTQGIEVASEGPEDQPEVKPRIRCWDDDRKLLVQLSADLLIFNQVGDYIGWTEFKNQLMRVFGILRGGLSNFRFASIRSLRLTIIDNFTVSRENFTIGKYLNCSGSIIPQWYEDVSQAIDISLGRGFLREDDSNRSISVKVRKSENLFKVRFETNVWDKVQLGTALDNECLDKLYDESKQIFEAMITDTMRNDIMGGPK